MAKEIQTRLPQPQKRLTQTYSRPNPIAPQAPQGLPMPLPYDPAMERASMRLVNAMTEWGLVEQKREQDLIKQEEEIRIAKMDEEELEGELKKLALEAEQLNTWAISSNPFRVKTAMENVADRVMRGSYAAALEKQTSKFADPLDPDSEEKAAQFARDTFRELDIPGFWAQARASEMYDSMSSNWLANVRSKKSQRLEAQAHEDVQDITYRALTDFRTDPINHPWEETLSRIAEGADEGRSITGLSMRDDIVVGMRQFYTQQANTAVNEGDIEDIESLIASLDAIEELTEGPMALSKQQAAELGDIRVFLEKAEERVGEQSRTDIERDEQRAEDLGNAWIVENSGGSLPVDLAHPSVVELREAMINAGISPTAVNNYFASTFRSSVDSHVRGGGRPNQKILDATMVALRDMEDHERRKAFIYTQDLPVQTQEALAEESRRRRDSDVRSAAMVMIGPDGSTRDSLAKSQAATSAATSLLQDRVDPADLDDLTNLEVDINRWVEEGGRAAAKGDYATSAERHKAIDDAIAARVALISKVREGGGTDYNLELAMQEGIPAHIIEGMAMVSRTAALTELRGRESIKGLDDAGDVALFGGINLRRALNAYADDIYTIWTDTLANPKASALSRSKATIEANTKTAAMRKDAAKFIEEMVSITGTPFKAHKITPSGVVSYIPSSGALSWGTPGWKEDAQLTNELLQAERILGLTPEEMISGKTKSGLVIKNFDNLKDPKRCGMIPVESFETDFAQLANTNTPDMSQEELLGKLKGNGITEGYNAYVEMVGVNDAIGFDAFLNWQINGIGRHRLPVPDADVMKQLALGTTQ